MKYQSLVSSTTPSDLQEWLGQELEDRGIDSVYARSVLSLLQQDCVDIEPWECQHFKNRQLKYGGPENLYSATKSKHQKWKTWSKQMLLTSNSCCKTVISDLERLKKKAAVDCLRSASDYVNDIEELIDKVCVKLYNFKNLKGEKDEIHLRNIKDQKILDPFFIPPSSPTDEIKKYFAAFPPLNDKLEKATDIYQQNIKNAWCGVCVLKRNPKSFTLNKCNQPIIPYSPLKQIKSIYQNVESTILLDHNNRGKKFLANSKATEKNCIDEAPGNCQINRAQQIELTKQVLNSVKGSWKAMYCFITKTITLPLEHLYFIHINKYFILGENNFNSDYLKITIEELNFFIKTLSKSNFLILNFDKSSNQGATKNVYSNLVIFQKVVSDNFFDCADFIDSVMPVSINKTLSSNSNIDQFCSQDFDVLSLPSIKGVKVSLVEDSPISVEQPSLEYLSFEGNKLDINFINYSRSEDSGSKFLSFLESNCQIENICADSMSEKPKCEFSILSNRESIWSFDPNITRFCGSFETENKCNRNLPSNTLIANKEMIYSVDIVRDSHSIEGLDLFMPAKSSFLPIQQDYSITNCLKENLSIREKDSLHLKVDNIVKNQLCLNSAVNSKINIGQQLLKKVLFINKIYIRHSPHKAFQPSTAFEKIASLKPHDKEIPNTCIKSEIKELKSQAFANSNKCTAYVQHCKDTVQASSAADWPQKNTKTFNEMWLLYWGDNHNFIAHTWQKDFTNSGNIPNVELPHVSEAIVALSKEIREDGDELLKGLGSIPGISDDPIMYGREMPVCDQNNFDYDRNFNFQTSSNIEYDTEISFLPQIADSPNFIDLNDANICSPVIDTSFAVNNMESDSPQMLHGCVSHDQLHNFDNSLKAIDYTDLSAFPHSYENVNPIDSDYYAEGGGWSFTSDSVLDYSYVNPYERSCSLDDLDLENTEYSEFLNQKRIRCTSETDDDIKQLIRKQNQSQLQKRMKQKIITRKRPCLFFLQGSCCRSDCKYSHDLSTTTCRFWKEGSCFKGTTCPFLHGYIKESNNELDELLNNDKDYSYSLESEADFPSLSSAKSEPSKSKSAPIKIVHAKGK